MPEVRVLPDAHTDFIFSVQWEDSLWTSLLVVVVFAVGLVGALLYRRRRRR